MLVGLTLHLSTCLLIPFCEDEERVRIIMTRLFGELLYGME